MSLLTQGSFLKGDLAGSNYLSKKCGFFSSGVLTKGRLNEWLGDLCHSRVSVLTRKEKDKLLIDVRNSKALSDIRCVLLKPIEEYEFLCVKVGYYDGDNVDLQPNKDETIKDYTSYYFPVSGFFSEV